MRNIIFSPNIVLALNIVFSSNIDSTQSSNTNTYCTQYNVAHILVKLYFEIYKVFYAPEIVPSRSPRSFTYTSWRAMVVSGLYT